VIDVETIRSDACNIVLAMVSDVQAKDAPYVSLATRAEWYHRSPRIFTNDASFSRLDSEAVNLPNVTVEYVPDEDEEASLPKL
jgi:predicted nucleic acid-binding protein